MPSLVNRFFFQIRNRQSLDSSQLCHTSPYMCHKKTHKLAFFTQRVLCKLCCDDFSQVWGNNEHIPRWLKRTNASAVQFADYAITHLSDETKMLSEQESDTYTLYIGHASLYIRDTSLNIWHKSAVHQAHFFVHLAHTCMALKTSIVYREYIQQ